MVMPNLSIKYKKVNGKHHALHSLCKKKYTMNNILIPTFSDKGAPSPINLSLDRIIASTVAKV